MNDSLLGSPRIEQFLDIPELPQDELARRLPNAILILELTADAMQRRAFGFQTTALDTGGVRALWQHMATLQKKGHCLKSDGFVRFAFPVAKKHDGIFNSRISVGRTGACDICLPDERISKLHCYFTHAEDAFSIIDAGSRNNTHLNGVRLTPQRPYRAMPGDRITIGPFELSFLDRDRFRSYIASLLAKKSDAGMSSAGQQS